MDDEARAGQGTRVRREVLGDAHVDRAVAATTPLTAPFQDIVTRYAWGDVWSRPGLDRRTRSMLTLALLASLGHETELALHVRGAVNNGVTHEEIGEGLVHTALTMRLAMNCAGMMEKSTPAWPSRTSSAAWRLGAMPPAMKCAVQPIGAHNNL